MNDTAVKPAPAQAVVGKFTTGSIMRHVVVMSASGAVGLIAIFAVDLLSLLYISWLGNINFTAGVGYATAVMFFSTSTNVGAGFASLGSGRARAGAAYGGYRNGYICHRLRLGRGFYHVGVASDADDDGSHGRHA